MSESMDEAILNQRKSYPLPVSEGILPPPLISPPMPARPMAEKRQKSPRRVLKNYYRVAVILALSLLLAFWVGLWILNGISTVGFVWALGGSIGAGVGLHLVISVLEQHLLRAKAYIGADLWPVLRWPIYVLVFLVGFFAIGASTGAGLFAGWHWQWWGYGFTPTSFCTMIATGIAVLPEPFGVITAIALYRVIKQR